MHPVTSPHTTGAAQARGWSGLDRQGGLLPQLRPLATRYRLQPVTRRAAIVTAAAFLAGCVLYARLDIAVHGVPLWLLTGTFYAVIVGPIALGTLLFFPALATLTEAVAASRLCFASFSFAFPSLGLPLLSQPLVTTTIVLGGAALLRWVLWRIETGEIDKGRHRSGTPFRRSAGAEPACS